MLSSYVSTTKIEYPCHLYFMYLCWNLTSNFQSQQLPMTYLDPSYIADLTNAAMYEMKINMYILT